MAVLTPKSCITKSKYHEKKIDKMTLLYHLILQENITELFKLALIKKINLTTSLKQKKKSENQPIRDV